MLKAIIRTTGLVLALLFLPAVGHAEESGAKPINLSLFTPVQIFPAEASIHGFRFSLLYGVLDQGQRLDWLHSGVIVAMRPTPSTWP